ncbi:hypothetical protein CY34DRAFT_598129 [Suillus luteus UH-Slu-Lm8-n1]|uniref:Uncharacterized protein n=1 Tax=Suillus luteus UH-Slu-Lm8-n1 TaxID=930992 RepID=A0A0D0BNE8_9AGAM|nr:hypothetical protein CY34DRAFT_598129 [Suillus luteus UH-Slu-Lm8-n1]
MIDQMDAYHSDLHMNVLMAHSHMIALQLGCDPTCRSEPRISNSHHHHGPDQNRGTPGSTALMLLKLPWPGIFKSNLQPWLYLSRCLVSFQTAFKLTLSP